MRVSAKGLPRWQRWKRKCKRALWSDALSINAEAAAKAGAKKASLSSFLRVGYRQTLLSSFTSKQYSQAHF